MGQVMPELPEIETIVRRLREQCVGHTIKKVRIRWPRHIAKPSPRQFRQRIGGQSIQSLERRGKYLVFKLSSDTLLIHLRMSGDLVILPSNAQPRKYEHTVICLDNHYDLRFCDGRKFGKVYLVAQAEEVLGKLGPEPLEDTFTAKALAERLSSRKRMLKPLLLDQAFLAGVGNIYADEALHAARLHPMQRSNTLSDSQAEALWESIRWVLQEGIRHNGSSIDWVYQGGQHQNHFSVYQRTDKPCHSCGTPVKKITVGQRGTHYCPTCQTR